MEKVLNQILAELQALKEGQTRMESRMDNLDHNQTRMESRLDNLDHKIDGIDSGLLKLELRMENEVIEKIRGLYDDREIQHDVNSRILAALERIESKITTHDVQIHILDKTKANKRKAK